MRNKGLLTIAAIVAVVAVGGIGFAALTSTLTVTVNATAGNWYIDGSVSGTYTAGSSGLAGNCVPTSQNYGTGGGSAPLTPAQTYSLTVTATLFPGDKCVVTMNIDSAGTLGINVGTFTYAVTPSGSNGVLISESDFGAGYLTPGPTPGCGTGVLVACGIDGSVTATFTNTATSLLSSETDSWTFVITASP